MIISSAQFLPSDGELQKNLETHYRLIEKAALQNADLILFPEMSLTGYMRNEAQIHALKEEDSALLKLKTLAKSKQMIIVVGAPVSINGKLYIGSFIILPNGETKIYTKQYLHDGEELFFCSSLEHNPIIEYKDERISFAICADINNEQHPLCAAEQKSTLYLSSIFFTPTGIDDAYLKLGRYANKYGMNILMSNYIGKSCGWNAAGCSAFWDRTGKKIEALNANDEGLLIVQKNGTEWNVPLT